MDHHAPADVYDSDDGHDASRTLLREWLGGEAGPAVIDHDDDDDDDLATVRYACARVSIRVATVLAATLSVLIERVGQPRTVIAVDGSLYKRHPKMHRLMTDFIGQLLPEGTRFELILAEDGSGKGAGIAAAVATKLLATSS